MSGRRRRRSRLLLAGLALVALLAAAEVVVRLAGLVNVTAGVPTADQATFYRSHMLTRVDDPALGYANAPGASVTAGGVAYRHDEHGWRVLPGDPADGPAVAFLGDSTTYGWGVPADQTLPAQVTALLGGRIRALDLGVNGYDTRQEVALYDRDRRALGDAPVVVLVFYPNDPVADRFQWDGDAGALYVDALPVPAGWKPVLWHSGLYRALAIWHGERLEARGALAPSLEHMPEVIDAVRHLAGLVREDGRRLLVAHLPAMVDLDPYPYQAYVDALAAGCAGAGVSFVDLLPAFLAERDRQAAAYVAQTGKPPERRMLEGFLARYWLVPEADHHLTGEGNAVAARALATALEPLLP